MQKIITKVAMFGGGVREFEDNVNEQLSNGWTARNVTVTKSGLRMVCMAVLERDDAPEHPFERTAGSQANSVVSR